MASGTPTPSVLAVLPPMPPVPCPPRCVRCGKSTAFMRTGFRIRRGPRSRKEGIPAGHEATRRRHVCPRPLATATAACTTCDFHR
jgi:hypothetical protein